jgi:hypothetical protein
MLNTAEILAIISAFRSSLVSIDPLGSAFEPSRIVVFGDSAFKRTMQIGSTEWVDTVNLTFEQTGIDSYRTRIMWHTSIRPVGLGTSASATIIALADSETSDIAIAKTVTDLRNEIDRKHVVFVKNLLDSVSGHEPVIIK